MCFFLCVFYFILFLSSTTIKKNSHKVQPVIKDTFPACLVFFSPLHSVLLFSRLSLGVCVSSWLCFTEGSVSTSLAHTQTTPTMWLDEREGGETVNYRALTHSTHKIRLDDNTQFCTCLIQAFTNIFPGKSVCLAAVFNYNVLLAVILSVRKISTLQ